MNVLRPCPDLACRRIAVGGRHVEHDDVGTRPFEKTQRFALIRCRADHGQPVGDQQAGG
jgi:hypothetical protein